MSYQWDSQTLKRGPSRTIPSEHSLSPTHTHIGYVVPPGTVASRIRFLQSLANPISTKHASPTDPGSREKFGTCFVRRLASQFEHPASRNANPTEQTAFEKAPANLALRTQTTTHNDASAVKLPYGLAGHIKPSRVTETLQDDTTFPCGALPWSGPANSLRQSLTGLRKELSRELGGSCSGTGSEEVNDSGPSHVMDIKDRDTHYRELTSRRHATGTSDTSTITTSTIRRQSVRELFRDYGIKRPAGFASVKSGFRGEDNMLGSAGALVSRRVSSSASYDPLTKCWICSRHVDHELDGKVRLFPGSREVGAWLTAEPRRKEDQVPVSSPGQICSKQPAQERRKKISEPKPWSPLRQMPQGEAAARIQPIMSKKFPACNDGGLDFLEGFHQPPPHPNAVSREWRYFNVSSTTKGVQSVKDSPFLVADHLCGGNNRSAFPINRRKNWPKGRSFEFNTRQPSSTSPKQLSNVVFQTCHLGHSPTVGGGSHQKTDFGQISKRSIINNGPEQDMCDAACPLRLPSHRSQVSRSSSKLGPKTKEEVSNESLRRYPGQLARKEAQDCMYEDHFGYVECHGYSGTGHVRHESPLTTKVHGRCQHRPDDCQCGGCQHTYHDLRCCVYEDQKPIALHQRPSTRETPKLKISSQLPRSAHIDSLKEIQTPPTASDFVSPNGIEYTECSPSVNFTKAAVPPHAPSTSTIAKKSHDLPQSKRVFLAKEISRRLKPIALPPRISILRTKYKTEVVSAPIPTSRSAQIYDSRSMVALPGLRQSYKKEDVLQVHSSSFGATPFRSTFYTDTDDPRDTFLCLHEKRCRRGYKIPQGMKVGFKEKLPPFSSRISKLNSLHIPLRSRIQLRSAYQLFSFGSTRMILDLWERLLKHHEELRKIERECENMIEEIVQQRRGGFLESKMNRRGARTLRKKIEELEKSTSAQDSDVATNCENRGLLHPLTASLIWSRTHSSTTMTAKEGKLMDSETFDKHVGEGGSARNNLVEPLKLDSRHEYKSQEDNSGKKDKTENETSSSGPEIVGITVVIHLRGWGDLIIRAGSCSGGEASWDGNRGPTSMFSNG